jgi:hypothetical protein
MQQLRRGARITWPDDSVLVRTMARLEDSEKTHLGRTSALLAYLERVDAVGKTDKHFIPQTLCTIHRQMGGQQHAQNPRAALSPKKATYSPKTEPATTLDRCPEGVIKILKVFGLRRASGRRWTVSLLQLT